MTETYSTQGPICPHCSFQFVADEAHYFDENAYVEDHCDNCDKSFAVTLYSITTWWCAPKEEE